MIRDSTRAAGLVTQLAFAMEAIREEAGATTITRVKKLPRRKALVLQSEMFLVARHDHRESFLRIF